MSNLSLPTLTYANLTAMLKPGKLKKLAFETTAITTPNGVALMHHGTQIALIAPDRITVTNAGWSSQTTRGRIHAVLSDNSTRFSLGQKNFEQVLTQYGPGSRVVSAAHKGFTSATIVRMPDTFWELTEFNGEAVAVA